MGELKGTVEFSLNDQRVSFRRFLETECGLILRLVPPETPEDEPTIQIIRETFRSFLLGSERCSPEFPFYHQTAHGDMASISIELMSNHITEMETLTDASSCWVDHLIPSGPDEQSATL